MAAATFKLVKKTKFNYEARDCDVYTYQCGEKVVKFFLHPTQSFSFLFMKETNVPARLRNKVSDAFLTVGSRVPLNTTFEEAIATLTV